MYELLRNRSFSFSFYRHHLLRGHLGRFFGLGYSSRSGFWFYQENFFRKF